MNYHLRPHYKISNLSIKKKLSLLPSPNKYKFKEFNWVLCNETILKIYIDNRIPLIHDLLIEFQSDHYQIFRI